MHNCRYRDVIIQQLQTVCGTSSAPVWRQSKDMLSEEGIEIAPQLSDQGSGAAPAEAQVQVSGNVVLSLAHACIHTNMLDRTSCQWVIRTKEVSNRVWGM